MSFLFATATLRHQKTSKSTLRQLHATDNAFDNQNALKAARSKSRIGYENSRENHILGKNSSGDLEGHSRSLAIVLFVNYISLSIGILYYWVQQSKS